MKFASGILPITLSTREIGLAWRSPEVNEGNCFGVIGGMQQPGLDLIESALVELGEEMGYYGPIEPHSAFLDRRRGFQYHSFVGLVPEPFPFIPECGYEWETSYLVWDKYERIVAMMSQTPKKFHRGLLTLFRQSKDLIETFA